jgi:SWI/SNF-related matrix-associated actin-dependent regulator 1 of chromatin subfamily A
MRDRIRTYFTHSMLNIDIPELFPYQISGSDWLAPKTTAILADEMGLGKSAQAIRAADKAGAKRILVLCPAVARRNWLREFAKFSPTPRTWTVVESRSASIPPWSSVVSSYDLAGSLSTTTCPGHFDLIILDEAHYLKSLDTKRTKAVLGKDGLVRRTKKIWALSGTPAPNHYGELWPLLYTFGITDLKFDKFIARYCLGVDTSYGFQIKGNNLANMPELKRLLAPHLLRRRKVEVMKELPPISYHDVVVEPGPVDLEMEQSFTQYIIPFDRRDELNEKLARERALVESIIGIAGFNANGMKALEAMAQSVSTLRRYNGIQKVQGAVDLISAELEANAYEKVVIFAIHRDVIEGLRARLSKFRPVTLYGGTDHLKREKNIDRFQKDKRYRVFIGNIMAAGTAITLTAAHQVVFVEQDWVPGNNAQAAMRCHRIGQKNPVTVRFIGLADSLDERVAQVLKRKTRELTLLFDEPSV